jgi:hypothetical protein
VRTDKARVENGVDDGLKQRLSLLEHLTEAIAHPRWCFGTIPYTKMIALIQLFKAALTKPSGQGRGQRAEGIREERSFKRCLRALTDWVQAPTKSLKRWSTITWRFLAPTNQSYLQLPLPEPAARLRRSRSVSEGLTYFCLSFDRLLYYPFK